MRQAMASIGTGALRPIVLAACTLLCSVITGGLDAHEPIGGAEHAYGANSTFRIEALAAGASCGGDPGRERHAGSHGCDADRTRDGDRGNNADPVGDG